MHLHSGLTALVQITSAHASTTKIHNRILEVNLYNRVACQERFVIPLPTFYKPVIEIQMRLYKTDCVIPLA